jgi:hypothetical protein
MTPENRLPPSGTDNGLSPFKYTSYSYRTWETALLHSFGAAPWRIFEILVSQSEKQLQRSRIGSSKIFPPACRQQRDELVTSMILT